MRIVSLVPSATEMLFALELGDSVVGVTHECDYPAAATGLPQLTATVLPAGLDAAQIDAAVREVVGEGRALYSLDEELLAELAPDLIVTQAVCEVCAVSYQDVVAVAARLPSRPRVIQQDPSTLTEVLEDVGRLADAAAIAARGAALRERLQARLDAVRESVATAARPRALALEWLDPPFLGGHWVPEMIAIAGAEDVAGRIGEKSPQVAWEDLAGLRPEVVVAMPCGWYAPQARQQALEHRARIEALAPEAVYAVDAASSFSRPGPRLVEGVELLAHLFHPERVAAPSGLEFFDLSGSRSP